jgi:trimeric autotransporter adhesin
VLVNSVAAQPCMPGWTGVGGGTSGSVEALSLYSEPSGTRLFAGGNFWVAGSAATGPVARWDGENWSRVGDLYFNGIVHALAVFDDGNGPTLFAGGGMGPGPGFPGECVARWDGHAWSAVGIGLQRNDLGVRALAVHDQGAGSQLYAGGLFWIPGYGTAGPRNLARWSGTAWLPVGGGTNHTVESMLSYDDGTGPGLVIVGSFTSAGGLPTVRYMARWNGQEWSDLLAGWDAAASWGRMLVFDPGTGPALHFAGYLWRSTTGISRGLWRRDGGEWSLLGSTDRSPSAAVAWDDGSGSAIYIAGDFTQVNGTSISRVARWKHGEWSGFGGQSVGNYVRGMLGHDHPVEGPTLYIAATINIPGAGQHIGRYTSCIFPDPCYPNCDASTTSPILNVEDFTCFITEFASALALPPQQQLDHYANCDQSTTPPVLNVQDFTCFINRFAQGCP